MHVNSNTDHLDAVAAVSALGGAAPSTEILAAHIAATGGETRPQQTAMAEAVDEAITSRDALVVQAGTGTGKSFAYLFPIAASGRRAIIATATNQLSEQLVGHDLPAVADTMRTIGKPVTYSLLKGRANYLCLAKKAELERLDEASTGPEQEALFTVDDEPKKPTRAEAREAQEVAEWARTTTTGDRTDAPPVSEKIWAQMSTTAADCPGAAKCPFGDTCFSEKARSTARRSQIVVTNHALLAQDFAAAATNDDEKHVVVPSLFGPHDIIVIDEAHDFPASLTSAMSEQFSPHALGKLVRKTGPFLPDEVSSATHIDPLVALLDQTEAALAAEPAGPIDKFTTAAVKALNDVRTLLGSLMAAVRKTLSTLDKTASRYTRGVLLLSQLEEANYTLLTALTPPPQTVRWVSTTPGQRGAADHTYLYVAPIDVGDTFINGLEGRTPIATSATLTLGTDFTPLLHSYGLPDTTTTLDVGSPFDYPQQGMLYIPNSKFPAPVGADRKEHKAAVLDEAVTLITAAGGRTLALFTTTAAAKDTAKHLRDRLPGLNILAHGDAPATQLVAEFLADETSVLCATMGLWQGVSPVGATCSLVIVDKLAFPPPSDVLVSARQRYAEEQGRNGFRDVVLAETANRVAQAAGRLIRTSTDRGVVAVLDPRLHTKSYGRDVLASLPPFRVFTDRRTVTDALTRLTGGLPDDLPPRRTSAAKPRKRTTATKRRSRSARRVPH